MSVKLYTPDANVIVHETKVDFRRRVVQRQINLVQYDKSMPVIAVQLCSNGNEYVLPENASAYIRFGKRDHTYVYNECLGCDQSRTIVYFAITDQMTIFYGEHTPIVELRIGDTVAGSGSIPIWIDRNPIQNGDTESKSDLSVFEKAIEAAQKINVKLPTDLKATATNLSLLAGSTKIGSGINLSGFEYDEATKTLKASGGTDEVITATKTSDPEFEALGFTSIKLDKVPTSSQFILSYDNESILMYKNADGLYTGASFASLYSSGLSYALVNIDSSGNAIGAFRKYDLSFLNDMKRENEGKVLTIESTGHAFFEMPPRYEHTVTLKTSAGAILWTQTMRNSSNTIVNSYANLKTLFGGAIYAGFGEYCQLDLRGGTEATDKLIKADGTEATLASLGAIVYTDKCFLPK